MSLEMINTICTVVLALCAILALIQQDTIKRHLEKIATLIKNILKKIPILKRIKIDRIKMPRLKGTKYEPKNISRWVSIQLPRVATLFMAGLIISIFLDYLNLPSTLAEIVKKECNIIALETMEDVLKKSREDYEVVITSLVDSATARKVVYSNAIEQAKNKGYLYLISDRYITSEAWREKGGSTKLLTDEEKSIIKEYSYKENDKDLYDLMYLVLSDDKMIKALQKDRAYEIPTVSEYHNRHITPYDKIGIIGGYISELQHELIPN